MTQRRKMGDRRRAPDAGYLAALASTHAAYPGVYASYLRPERPRIVTTIVDDAFKRDVGMPPAPELPQRRGTCGLIIIESVPSGDCAIEAVTIGDVAYDGIVDQTRGLVTLRPMKGGEK